MWVGNKGGTEEGVGEVKRGLGGEWWGQAGSDCPWL